MFLYYLWFDYTHKYKNEICLIFLFGRCNKLEKDPMMPDKKTDLMVFTTNIKTQITPTETLYRSICKPSKNYVADAPFGTHRLIRLGKANAFPPAKRTVVGGQSPPPESKCRFFF